MTLDQLDLTPNQHAELSRTDDTLVNAWLEALSLTSGLKSPTGWFLAGIRTGQPPADINDARRRQAVLSAETLIRNLGHALETEQELVETLFSPAQLTADTATLERVEAETRGHPRRDWFGATLEAQLAHTRAHGRQEIPGTGGPLLRYDSAALRERMLALWQRVRPLTIPEDAGPPDHNNIDWEAG